MEGCGEPTDFRGNLIISPKDYNDEVECLNMCLDLLLTSKNSKQMSTSDSMATETTKRTSKKINITPDTVFVKEIVPKTMNQ